MRSCITMLVAALLLTGFAASSYSGEIHEAVRRGDLPAVQRLVAADRSLLAAKDADGSPPLLVAARAGNVEIARYLLDAGADMNLGDNENSNALHLAACGGQNAMIDFLLERGMDIHAEDVNGMNAVLFAGGYNKYETARHLLSKGARADSKNRQGTTLMHQAAAMGNLEFMKYLVSQGQSADVGLDQWGRTPLTAAAFGGRREVVEYLLANGVNVNEPASDGQTALFAAAGGGKREIVDILLAKGADPNAGENGQTALAAAAAWSNDPAIVRALLARGADVKVVDGSGWTVLHRMAQRGNVEIARLLVDAGVEIDRADNQGQTALLRAVERGHAPLVQYLVSKGANVGAAESKMGSTPLHVAAAKGYGDVAGFLVSAGAPVNAKDSAGNTPLYYAVRHGNSAMAEMIRAKGGEGGCKKTPASSILSKNLKEGEAIVWYTGHAGWAVQTKNNFLVFDYFQDGRAPDEAGILNGCVNPRELAGKNVTVFVSHTAHPDHYNKKNFQWNRELPGITWVFGQAPDTTVACELIDPRQTKNINGMEVTAARSTDAGVGFLVAVDGLTIMHSGDLHNRDANVDGVFSEEIDFLAGRGHAIDLAFFPVSGCGFGDVEIVKKGVYSAVAKLDPAAIFPMHAGSACSRYYDFEADARKAGCSVPEGLAQARGDRFLYRGGKLEKI